MCKAIDFANGINEQITEAKEYYNKLRIKQSVLDGVEQDILHKIEDLDKFSLYTGWKICMSLSKLRKARRKTKNELKTMQSLINQLGEFTVKDAVINKEATTLEELTNKKIYHKRQLEMTGDILEEVDDIINNINYKSVLVKEKINNKFNEDKLYNMSDTLPKIKGNTIKVKYNSLKQKNHLINSVALSYSRYKIHEQEKYVELINRKRNK
jgi:hypothetical protein